MKYSIGKTYGNDTFALAKQRDYHPVSAPLTHGTRPPIRNEIPNPTGDNKFTKNMVPGYQGYVPRSPFKFGDTYKIGCDYCIDEHITNLNKRQEYEVELYKSARTPRLNPLAQDPIVRDHLNTYRDTHPARPILLDDKRAPTEPPMPGYQGYVPRIGQTELGLGCRYATSTKQGFEAFYNQVKMHSDRRQGTPRSSLPALTKPEAIYNKRIFMPDGMIPRYCGYLPQRRYQFGATYGNTTRSLDVCNHDMTCYGDYAKAHPKPNAAFVC
jgi:hypothetical protein